MENIGNRIDAYIEKNCDDYNIYFHYNGIDFAFLHTDTVARNFAINFKWKYLNSNTRVINHTFTDDHGYTKEKRIDTLSKEFLKTFGLKNVTIKEELLPIFELKYSKSKKVWTLYYFENYIASEVDNLDILFAQNIYEQKVLPIDSNITSIDGLELASNIPYLLSIEENIKIINNNIIKV